MHNRQIMVLSKAECREIFREHARPQQRFESQTEQKIPFGPSWARAKWDFLLHLEKRPDPGAAAGHRPPAPADSAAEEAGGAHRRSLRRPGSAPPAPRRRHRPNLGAREIRTTPKRGGLLLGCNPRVAGPRLKTPAFTVFRPHCALTRGGPVKPASALRPRPARERVLVLLHAQPVQRYVRLLLLPYVLRYRRLVQADGRHAVAGRPELPVAELVLHVRMPVEDHQRALALQVAHHAGHAVLRRYREQHVHVVGHQVPLDYLYPLVLAELPEDLPEVGPDLVVDHFPSILRREHDVVLAHPLRVRQAVGLLGHTPHHPSVSEPLRPEQSQVSGGRVVL